MKLARLNSAAVRTTGATKVAGLSNSRMKGIVGGAIDYLADAYDAGIYSQFTTPTYGRSARANYIVGIYERYSV